MSLCVKALVYCLYYYSTAKADVSVHGVPSLGLEREY